MSGYKSEQKKDRLKNGLKIETLIMGFRVLLRTLEHLANTWFK